MNSAVLQSHTATQQWQSFEMRMRRRRVERCLLRASVAIEAGVLDDAREASTKCRRLDPNEPGTRDRSTRSSPLQQIPHSSNNRRSNNSAVRGRRCSTKCRAAGSRRFATAAALLVVGAAAGAWLWSSSSRTAPKSGEIATAAAPLVQQTPADASQSLGADQRDLGRRRDQRGAPPGDAPIATTGLAAVSDTSARPDLQRAANAEPSRGAPDASAAAGIPHASRARPTSQSGSRATPGIRR